MAQVNDIGLLCQDLIKAYEVLLNPSTSTDVRLKTHNSMEEFKANYLLSVEAGFYMLDQRNATANMRSCALHLIDNAINFWQKFTKAQKTAITNKAFEILQNCCVEVDNCVGDGVVIAIPARVGDGGGGGGGFGGNTTGIAMSKTDFLQIKNVLVRIVKKIIIFSNPRQWASYISELKYISYKGDIPTELVLTVLQQLIEDLKARFRHYRLWIYVDDIYEFSMCIIMKCVKSQQEKVNVMEMEANAFGYATTTETTVRIVNAALSVLCHLNNLRVHKSSFCALLCELLTIKPFMYKAAECFSDISLNDRTLESIYAELLRILTIINLKPNTTDLTAIELQHRFLKQILQILRRLTFFSRKKNRMCSINFEILLECLLTLLRHPSITIVNGAAICWTILLNHNTNATNHKIIKCIPHVFNIVAAKLLRVSYPKMLHANEGISVNTYIRIDFCKADDFLTFYNCYRFNLNKLIAAATVLQPLVAYGYCAQMFDTLVEHAQNECKQNATELNDTMVLDWEVLVTLFDIVLDCFWRKNIAERPEIETIFYLLEKCLQVRTFSALIEIYVIRFITVLHVYMRKCIALNCEKPTAVTTAATTTATTAATAAAMTTIKTNVALLLNNLEAQNLYNRSIERFLAALVCLNSNSNSNCINIVNINDVQRRNALANLHHCAVKQIHVISKEFPEFLLPVFDKLYTYMQTFTINSATALSIYDITLFIELKESLILLINNFEDVNKETYLTKLLQELPIEKFANNFQFFNNYGNELNESSTNTNINIANKINRMQILESIYTNIAVAKCCKTPKYVQKNDNDIEVNIIENSTKNLAKNLLPLLPQVLSLLCLLHQLFEPTLAVAVTTAFGNDCFKLLPHEAQNLLVVKDIEMKKFTTTTTAAAAATNDLYDDLLDIKTNTAPNEMQEFLLKLLTGCYQFLGAVSRTITSDIYYLDNIATHIIDNIFQHIFHLPDYRLQLLLHEFLLPFLQNCPLNCFDAVLLPIFTLIAPVMHDKLHELWHEIEIMNCMQNGEETHEVIKDSIKILITEEYLGILKTLLLVDNKYKYCDLFVGKKFVSTLGAKLLIAQQTGAIIWKTVLKAISYPNDIINKNAVILFYSVIIWSKAENRLNNNVVHDAFKAILTALPNHVNEYDRSFLLQLCLIIYKDLRQKYPIVFDLLQKVKFADFNEVKKFDEYTQNKNIFDPICKKLLKNITNGLSKNNYDYEEEEMC